MLSATASAQGCKTPEQLFAEGTLLLDMLEDRLHVGVAIEGTTYLLEVLRLHVLIAIGSEARHRREGKLLLGISIELTVKLNH